MRLLLFLPLTLACAPAKPGASTGTAGKETALDTAAPLDTAALDQTEETGDTEPVEPDPPCTVEGDGLLPMTEGDFVAAGSSLSATRARCAAVKHASAGAAGSVIEVGLEAWSGGAPPTLRWLGPTGLAWSEPLSLAVGSSSTLTLPQSGELLLRLDPADPDEAADDYTLRVSCISNCTLVFTRYPIVLMHGMGGSDSFLDTVDYYFEVPDALSAAGYPVAVPVVDAFDTVVDRSAQWQAGLDALEAAGVGRRFNLIGHSQGGLDARYLAGALLDPRVVSVITVGSPHHGSVVADAASGLLSADPLVSGLIDLAVAALASLVGMSGDDLVGQVADLTSENMAAFNAAVPDAPGIYYASWAGHSCGALEFDCQDAEGGEVVDPLLALTQLLVALVEGDNDGLVSTTSAQWGDFQGEIPADHLDEIGQVADVDNPAFDHVAFYLAEAARLAGLGY